MRLYLLVIIFSFSAWGHQSSLNSEGNPIAWTYKNIPLAITTNTSDMSATLAQNIILASIAQWNQSSSVQLIPAGSSYNNIIFDSNFNYGSAVIGVTELTYNSLGQIQTGTIRLNDNYFFRSSPGLYASGQVYLGDVVTHEMGHLLGLGHSEVLDSSMFYSSFSGQSTVAYDDISGVRKQYDSGYGQIYGYVKGGNSIGVLGAHVQAISRKTGEVVSAITNENGYFLIGGLNLDDTFYLYTSPIKKQESLPGYFANVQSQFCPASYVGSFYSACGSEHDGFAQGINLSSAQTSVNVGVVTINCALRTQTEYHYQKLQTSFSPLTIFDYAQETKFEKAFTGYFRSTSSAAWSVSDHLVVDLRNYSNLSGNPKYLKVSLVSEPLGDQLEYVMNFSQNSVSLPGFQKEISFDASTGTYNTDMSALLPLSASASENIFDLAIKARRLSNYYIAQTFSSPTLFTSTTHMPYLVIASVWEFSGGEYRPLIDSGPVLSDNQACLEAPYTYAVTRSNVPSESQSNITPTDAAALGAACGTIEPPKNGGGGSNLLLIATGFLMVAISKRAKKFLS